MAGFIGTVAWINSVRGFGFFSRLRQRDESLNETRTAEDRHIGRAEGDQITFGVGKDDQGPRRNNRALCNLEPAIASHLQKISTYRGLLRCRGIEVLCQTIHKVRRVFQTA